MNKKLFALLVILMTFSLIGIIFVQVFWIRTSVEDKEEQFSNTVSQVLDNVTKKIEEREINGYIYRLLRYKDTIGEPFSERLSNVFYTESDSESDVIRYFGNSILEENFNVPPTFFDNGVTNDSMIITSYTNKRTKIIIDEGFGLDGNRNGFNSLESVEVERLEMIDTLSNMKQLQFDITLREHANSVPVHKRVTRQEIELLLDQEFKNRDIDADFEYGIYSNGLPTIVKSKKFRYANTTVYKSPIFRDADGKTNFSLLLNFPSKKRYLVSSILGMAILSLLFTLVIIIAFSGAIYQLIKQKQISEIKTDFINNMTHEFKTPIATINLAVEAIRNPQIIGDEGKVKRYLQMIRDENKRMHAQVENVLRISKLEKNQLDISKDRANVHDIIIDAITHVELIAEDKGGYIKTHLDAKRSEVVANDMHFTNVIVNILDNGIKYSPESPKIDVFTEVVKNHIIIKIQDQGAGMSKAVLKKVFEKFYREHTGNIHNVKGHGLGLAYVKKIVDDHQGEVYAESEKGKGSTFYVKLPLI